MGVVRYTHIGCCTTHYSSQINAPVRSKLTECHQGLAEITLAKKVLWKNGKLKKWNFFIALYSE